MIEKIGEKVSVSFLSNHNNGSVLPVHMKWKNTVYTIQKVGLHYTLYRDQKLIHMFSVCDAHRFFLLALDTENLHWTLEEVADDTPN